MWLDELHKKPKTVRDKYAFLGALAITAVIALFWLVGLGVSFDSDSQNSTTATSTVSPTSAFGSFISELRERFSDVAEPLQELSEENISSNATTTQQATSSPVFTLSTSTATTSTTTRQGRSILIATTSSSNE